MLRYENLHEQVASWIEEKIVNTEFCFRRDFTF